MKFSQFLTESEYRSEVSGLPHIQHHKESMRQHATAFNVLRMHGDEADGVLNAHTAAYLAHKAAHEAHVGKHAFKNELSQKAEDLSSHAWSKNDDFENHMEHHEPISESADPHSSILPSDMYGFMHSTSHGATGSTHCLKAGLSTRFNDNHEAAHKYLAAHGYQKQSTEMTHDQTPFRGALHVHETHKYTHPDGHTATIQTLVRLNPIDTESKYGSVEISAPHIDGNRE